MLNIEKNHQFAFYHGMGDTISFAIALRHMKDINIGLCIHPERKCFFNDITNICYEHNRNHTNWGWALDAYDFAPPNKVTSFLLRNNIQPDFSLYKYKIHISPAAEAEAARLLPEGPNYVGMHFKGTDFIGARDVEDLCAFLKPRGFTPVAFNFSNPFRPDAKLLWEHERYIHADILAAVIQRCRFFVAQDSGPLHVAGATTTKSFGIWNRTHPVCEYCIGNDVTHLVTEKVHPYFMLERGGLSSQDKKKVDKATEFFVKNYQHRFTTRANYMKTLFEEIEKIEKPQKNEVIPEPIIEIPKLQPVKHFIYYA